MNVALPKPTQRYTYTDYVQWPGEVRGELLDGVFYDMASAPSIRHKDQVQKLALYEAVGVREFWLLHPIDRVLTIYTWEASTSQYGRSRVLAAEDAVALTILPDVSIDCDDLFAD